MLEPLHTLAKACGEGRREGRGGGSCAGCAFVFANTCKCAHLFSRLKDWGQAQQDEVDPAARCCSLEHQIDILLASLQKLGAAHRAHGRGPLTIVAPPCALTPAAGHRATRPRPRGSTLQCLLPQGALSAKPLTLLHLPLPPCRRGLVLLSHLAAQVPLCTEPLQKGRLLHSPLLSPPFSCCASAPAPGHRGYASARRWRPRGQPPVQPCAPACAANALRDSE